MIVKYKQVQKVFKIGTIEIGGQPGERPTVLIGSIFYGKHRLVKDPHQGIFDERKAKAQIDRETELSRVFSIPRCIDPIGISKEALIRYVRFLLEYTDAPILIDSPLQQVRMETIRYFKDSSAIPRLIYNSIAEDFTEEELSCIRECKVKHAVLLAFSPKAILPKDRLVLLSSSLLPAASRAGIEHILIDTGVLDMPSISWAGRTIHEIKETFGYPAGCAPANALMTWKKIHTMGIEAFQAGASAILGMIQCAGADFVLYGPMRFAPWVYPACATADALCAYGGKLNGIKPATPVHPLTTIFKD